MKLDYTFVRTHLHPGPNLPILQFLKIARFLCEARSLLRLRLGLELQGFLSQPLLRTPCRHQLAAISESAPKSHRTPELHQLCAWEAPLRHKRWRGTFDLLDQQPVSYSQLARTLQELSASADQELGREQFDWHHTQLQLDTSDFIRAQAFTLTDAHTTQIEHHLKKLDKASSDHSCATASLEPHEYDLAQCTSTSSHAHEHHHT